MIYLLNCKIEILKNLNDISTYENENINLIVNYYKTFKKEYNLEDWKKIRERIFGKMPKNKVLLKMYETDKLKSRYFDLP